MSCRVTCALNSGHSMFWSVQQSYKNTLIKNKKIIHCRRYMTTQNSTTNSALLKLSNETVKSQTLFNLNCKIKVDLRSQCLVCYHGNLLYSTQPTQPLPDDSDKDKVDKKEKLTLYQRLKKMYKEYWYVLIPVHLATSSVWFGGFYYLAACGIDIPALLESMGAPESWIESLKKSKAGNLVLAYTMYKVVTPLRYTVTIGGTTIAINYLKKNGWLKPVPNKEQLKQMYLNKKDVFKDLKTSYQDKMQVTKDEFMKTKKEMKQQYAQAKEDFHRSISETRMDLKEGVKSASDEWTSIGNSLSKNLKAALNFFSSKK